MTTRHIRGYTPPSVAFQLANQSRLVFSGHHAYWMESQDPEYRRYQEYRASLNTRDAPSSDAVVDNVKQQLKSKSRRGIAIAPASAPNRRR
ncbi:MAG: hypothetical protein ACR2OE_06730 [Thermomicrobiales bacterium]